MLAMAGGRTRSSSHKFSPWKVVAGKVFGVLISRMIVHYCNKLTRGTVGSLFLEAFKTWLDKAMTRHVLVFAED